MVRFIYDLTGIQVINEQLKELPILKKKEHLKELGSLIKRLKKDKINISLSNKFSLLHLMLVFVEDLFSNFFTEHEIDILTNIFSYVKLTEFLFHIENYRHLIGNPAGCL